MKKHLMLVLAGWMLVTGGILSAQDKDEAAVIVRLLQEYTDAVESKNMSEIEKYVLTTDEFTVFEGGHVNLGWTDYRDHHLAPELKQFQEFKYEYKDLKADVDQKLAVATFKYSIFIKMKEREISGEGLGTAILVKTSDGWKIRHIHTSRSRRPRNK